MRAVIVRPHRAGLFSLLNNVLTCLSLYDYVHVDWSEDCIYGNAWPELFETNAHPRDVPGITSIEEVSTYPHQMLTYKNAGLLYQAEKLIPWREGVNDIWANLAFWLKPDILTEVYKLSREDHDFWSAIGVLVRSHVHAGEQITGQSQTYAQYFKAIDEQGGEPSIFLMAADLETIGVFKEAYGSRVIYFEDVKRAEFRASEEPHLSTPQTPEDARKCLVEVLCLSQCRTLIHGVSNMATAALYINPGLKSVYIP